MSRIEVRSAHGDRRLGHVFDDGPTDAGGLRYYINSAALRFIPVKDLEREGYGEYAKLFGSVGSVGCVESVDPVESVESVEAEKGEMKSARLPSRPSWPAAALGRPGPHPPTASA